MLLGIILLKQLVFVLNKSSIGCLMCLIHPQKAVNWAFGKQILIWPWWPLKIKNGRQKDEKLFKVSKCVFYPQIGYVYMGIYSLMTFPSTSWAPSKRNSAFPPPINDQSRRLQAQMEMGCYWVVENSMINHKKNWSWDICNIKFNIK